MEHQRTARRKSVQEMIIKTLCTNKNQVVQGLIYIYHRKIGTVDKNKESTQHLHEYNTYEWRIAY